MKPLDDLTPEEQQNEELVASLSHALSKPASLSREEQASHVARVRERLFQSEQAEIKAPDLPLSSEIISSREQRDEAPFQDGHVLTSPRHRSRFLYTVNMLAAVAVVCALIGSALLIFAHHPASTRTGTPAPLPTTSPTITFASVSFTPATSYTLALRAITDLGLRPLPPSCTATILNPDGKVSAWFGWEPPASGFTIYPAGMYVTPTPLASSDWLARLRITPDVTGVRIPTTQVVFNCQLGRLGTPPPGTQIALAPQQAGTYLAVTFSQQAGSYDQALRAVSNLGLRLADPCLERTGKRPGAGYSAGQEQKYTATRTLVLATTTNSRTDWQQQLASLIGVQSVRVPAPITC